MGAVVSYIQSSDMTESFIDCFQREGLDQVATNVEGAFDHWRLSCFYGHKDSGRNQHFNDLYDKLKPLFREGYERIEDDVTPSLEDFIIKSLVNHLMKALLNASEVLVFNHEEIYKNYDNRYEVPKCERKLVKAFRERIAIDKEKKLNLFATDRQTKEKLSSNLSIEIEKTLKRVDIPEFIKSAADFYHLQQQKPALIFSEGLKGKEEEKEEEKLLLPKEEKKRGCCL